MSSVLGLDLGTQTGFALRNVDGGMIISGHWSLKPRRHESSGMRFINFRKSLADACETYDVKIIYYEEVRRHMGTDAAHIYGGLLAVLTAYCCEHGIEYCGIGVSTIKKHATGKGNSAKPTMLKAMMAKFPDQGLVEVKSPNSPMFDQADALAILSCGLGL